jgi:hypothetical protein
MRLGRELARRSAACTEGAFALGDQAPAALSLTSLMLGAGGGALLSRELPEPLQERRDASLLAEVVDAKLLQGRAVVGGLNRCDRFGFQFSQ